MNTLKVRIVVPALASVAGLVGAIVTTSAKIPFVNAYGQYITNVNYHCSIGPLTTNDPCTGTTGTPCHVYFGPFGTSDALTEKGFWVQSVQHLNFVLRLTGK